jgi:hypothetical protein
MIHDFLQTVNVHIGQDNHDKTHRSSIWPQGEIDGTDEHAVNNTGHHAKAIVTQMGSH